MTQLFDMTKIITPDKKTRLLAFINQGNLYVLAGAGIISPNKINMDRYYRPASDCIFSNHPGLFSSVVSWLWRAIQHQAVKPPFR